MPLPTTELTIEFGPIAPDAAEDARVPFTVRNEYRILIKCSKTY